MLRDYSELVQRTSLQKRWRGYKRLERQMTELFPEATEKAGAEPRRWPLFGSYIV